MKPRALDWSNFSLGDSDLEVYVSTDGVNYTQTLASNPTGDVVTGLSANTESDDLKSA